MNWKEFFKPTVTKIILTLLIFIGLSLFIPIIPISWYIQCFSGYCPPSLGYFTLIQVIQNLRAVSSVSYVPLILLELIVFYSISCGVIAVYKTKKK